VTELYLIQKARHQPTTTQKNSAFFRELVAAQTHKSAGRKYAQSNVVVFPTGVEKEARADKETRSLGTVVG
jgi:hypothetical protein